MKSNVPVSIAESILTFWFGDGLTLGWPSVDKSPLWWGGGAALDAQITAQFGDKVRAAVAGGLTDWESQPLDRLALVILLDQFTRNVFRSKPAAFAGDARAQTLVQQGLELRVDESLPWVGRVFFYMPLMHAENLALQDLALQRFTQLHASAPEPIQAKLKGNLDSAVEHRNIIAQFGRFAHRNAVLGRTSTAQELEFLTHGPRFGQ
jgi:uncharacterized protein (DUF924 family)